MSFSAIWTRRLKYMLTPQWDLYARISDRIEDSTWGPNNILDYGCGLGFGALRLGGEHRHVVGIDSDPEAIDFAKDIAGRHIQFYVADATKKQIFYGQSLKEPARSFRVITLIEVVEHLDVSSQCVLVERLAQVVMEEGTLYLSTPNKHSQWRKHAGHIGIHDPASLRALLEPRFSSVALEDYLGEPVPDDTTVSPLVAVCRGPK